MREKLIILFLILGFRLLCQAGEDFESGDFFSRNWNFGGDADWFISYNDPALGDFCARSGQIEGSESSQLSITIQTAVSGNLHFRWKASSEENEDFLRFYIDNSLQDAISGDQAWQNYLTNLSAGIHHLKWIYVKDSSIDENDDCGFIDDISFPPFTDYEHDLACLSVSAPSLMYSGETGVFEVSVYNFGSEAEADYSVTLFREPAIELETRILNMEHISDREKKIRLAWIIPEDEDPATAQVYARVSSSNDEFPDNDISPSKTVYLLQGDLIENRIGNGLEENNWIPFNFRLRNNIAQALYFPDEIPYSGNIVAVGYTNDFETNVQYEPVMLWMGLTTVQNLTNGWINPTSLTEVFDGNGYFPAGRNKVVLQFDDPFYYGGNTNLVIMSHRPYSMEVYLESDDFLSTHETPAHLNRSRGYNSNSVINPLSIPASAGYVFNRLPNTSLFIEVEGLASIEGFVYDTDSNILIDADVILQGSFKSTISNQQGFYRFGNIIPDSYTITASKTGYEPQSFAIEIQEDELLEIDFDLQPIDTITIEGFIDSNDEPGIGLEAHVFIEGYQSYETISDQNGEFQIEGIFAEEDYYLQIIKAGFNVYDSELEANSSDIDLGIISLQEIYFPPAHLNAIPNEDHSEIFLNWEAPVDLRDFSSYDLFRFEENDLYFPENWTQLCSAYPDTFFVDTDWGTLMPDNYRFAVHAVYSDGNSSETVFSEIIEKPVGIDITESEIKLFLTNYPNPVNKQTEFSFAIPHKSAVELSIFNIKGQLVRRVISEMKQPGEHKITWKRDNLSAGIYFYRLDFDDQEIIKKMVLMP